MNGARPLQSVIVGFIKETLITYLWVGKVSAVAKIGMKRHFLLSVKLISYLRLAVPATSSTRNTYFCIAYLY